MKLIIASLFILGTLSAFATDKVDIQISASSEELCNQAAKRLVEISRDLDEKELTLVEITNCNKSANGKYIKKSKYRNIIDYNH